MSAVTTNTIRSAINKPVGELNRSTSNAIAELTLALTNSNRAATDVANERLIELMATYSAIIDELEDIAEEVRGKRNRLERAIDAIRDMSATPVME